MSNTEKESWMFKIGEKILFYPDAGSIPQILTISDIKHNIDMYEFNGLYGPKEIIESKSFELTDLYKKQFKIEQDGGRRSGKRSGKTRRK
jgi:hypothetical protein